MSTDASNLPSTVVTKEASKAFRALARVLPKEGAAQVRVQPLGEPDEVAITLPREVLSIFMEVLDQMAQGNAVTVVPVHAELTTHQAARILNVSRPFLIGLLNAGKIPFRMQGTHRRIRFADLMSFKSADDVRRDEALAELTRQAQDLDLGY